MDFNHLKEKDPLIFKAIKKEVERQRNTLELIASENFTSLAVLNAVASPLTNKYAEGYPKARWYGGCRFVDDVEELARERAKSLFGAEYANVQPHSGTQANMAVMFSVLKIGDTVLAMDLACGGHLSHGHPLNFSGKLFKVISYGVDEKTEHIDYQRLRSLAKRHKPKMIVAGASAYPRTIDFKQFGDIAQEVGSLLLVDMAHFAGLVAAGIHPNPCQYADIVTATTHKTLRGPRGGFILAKETFANKIDTAIFPGIQGGPLMHTIAAKAVAFKEAESPSFKEYQKRVVENAREFVKEFKDLGLRIVAGGTDTHLLLVDLRNINITGKKASDLLEEVDITINKNLIPYDPQPAAITSGMRIGTPAITTRGIGLSEVKEIAQIIYACLTEKEDRSSLKKRVKKIVERFPLYPELKI
jgi:glycine hydroxymethyltransferase